MRALLLVGLLLVPTAASTTVDVSVARGTLVCREPSAVPLAVTCSTWASGAGAANVTAERCTVDERGPPGPTTHGVACDRLVVAVPRASADIARCAASGSPGVLFHQATLDCRDANVRLGSTAVASADCRTDAWTLVLWTSGDVACVAAVPGAGASCTGAFLVGTANVQDPFDCGAGAAGEEVRASGPRTLGLPVCVDVRDRAAACAP